MLSSGVFEVDVQPSQPPSLHESIVYSYYDSMGGGCNNWSPSDSVEMGYSTWQQQQEWNYWDNNIRAFEETGNGSFGGADLWTDENIWFLQQQLAE